MSLLSKKVRKIGGAFEHTGTVVSEFKNSAGEDRIVVEFDPPVKLMLHIYRPDQVKVIEENSVDMHLLKLHIMKMATCPKCGKALCLCNADPDHPFRNAARLVLVLFRNETGIDLTK